MSLGATEMTWGAITKTYLMRHGSCALPNSSPRLGNSAADWARDSVGVAGCAPGTPCLCITLRSSRLVGKQRCQPTPVGPYQTAVTGRSARFGLIMDAGIRVHGRPCRRVQGREYSSAGG